MLSDLEQGASPTLSVDLCVIGGGPAGITLAEELLDAGLTVLLAEGGGLTVDARDQALHDGESIGHPMELSEGRYRGLGGSAQRWGGRCAMLDPIDLEMRPWVPGSGWPFGWSELSQYYDRAQRALGFPCCWRDDLAAAQCAGAIAGKFGNELVAPFIWRFAVPDGRIPPPRPARPRHRKALHWGRDRRELLSRSPNVQVVLHANLIALVPNADEEGIACARFRARDGSELRVEARNFVLCCGGIENTRLLLNLNDSLHRKLLGAPMLGRFFMQHPRGRIVKARAACADVDRLRKTFGVLRATAAMPMQIEIGFALTEEAQRRHGILNASASIINVATRRSAWSAGKRLLGAARRGSLREVSLRDLWRVVAGGVEAVGNLWDKFVLGAPLRFKGGHFEVVADLEQQPREDSRILLSDAVDIFGVRKATVDWKLSEIERRTAHHLAEGVAIELSRAGFEDVAIENWLTGPAPITQHQLSGTYHFIGGTRMAQSSASGVVDGDARVFGLSNLFVAGCSVFATGGHANPTLTIVAMAIRLADHLRNSLRAERSPDPAVTASHSPTIIA